MCINYIHVSCGDFLLHKTAAMYVYIHVYTCTFAPNIALGLCSAFYGLLSHTYNDILLQMYKNTKGSKSVEVWMASTLEQQTMVHVYTCN